MLQNTFKCFYALKYVFLKEHVMIGTQTHAQESKTRYSKKVSSQFPIHSKIVFLSMKLSPGK